MTLSRLLVLLLISSFITESNAERSPTCSRNGRESKIADFGKKAMPIGALAVSAIKLDLVGAIMSQVLSSGLYALNKPLEKKIHKKRPCGCSGAFPSGHMIMYASSASLLHYRYGWQYGLPAYAIAIGFAADRVKNKAHSWWDMLGTAAAVNAIVYLVTPRFTPDVEYLPFFLWEDSCETNNCPADANKPLLVKPSLRLIKKEKSAIQFIPLLHANTKGGNKNYSVGFVMRF